MPPGSCDDARMPVMPGAEPFHHDGGPVGALLCHGFTGTPQSLRPWAEHLAAAGLTVSLPRLPGHGTTVAEANLTHWEDWYAEVDRSLAQLKERCDDVFVMGLSMGGTLALRLAEEHGDDIAGLVLVNPSLLTKRPDRFLLPVMRWAVPTWKGIASDIKKPGEQELAYDKIPVKASYQLTRLWLTTRTHLDKVTQPILVFRSTEDHIVEPDSCAMLREKVSSTDLHEVLLENSYHVATLDNDAQTIFDGSLEFVRRLARTAP
jgi:carboxylesterase